MSSPPTPPLPGSVSFRTTGPDDAPPANGAAGAPPGYELLGELGRGGMGVVYRARQVGLNRPCALKMILTGDQSSPEERERFRAEAEAIARLQHPHIVAVYEVGEHQGRPFFSLELCPGGALDRKLGGRPIEPREAAALVRALAEGAQAAHDKGILHRDLKPGNVLFAADGTPKVTDFGLAKRLDQVALTRTGAVIGTPAYMAPEQALGDKALGPAADVYALGAILYECLTGRPPFNAATVLDTLAQVVGQEPVPPRQLNAKVPRDVETICLKCLEKAPARRYGSARELADDLGRWLKGEPVRARRTGAMGRGVKWVRRNPAVAALTAAVALLLVAGASVGTGLAVYATGEAERADREAGEARAQAERADTERDAARTQAYRADSFAHAIQLDLAVRALVDHRDGQRGGELLASAPASMLNTWEHRHVQALHRRLASLTLKGHTSLVFSVAYSGDGKRIVSGSSDKTVKVWDAASGLELLTLKGHTGGVFSVAYSADGKRIVSGSSDRTVKVWDADSGQEKLTLKGHAGVVFSVAYSADGKRIVSGSSDKTVKVWDAASGLELLTLKGHTGGVFSVAYSADGKRIVSGSSDRTVKVWDADSGQEKLTLKGHTDTVLSVAYSADGKRIVSGSEDHTLKVWDAASGQEKLTLKGHTSFVLSVAYSADGKRIVSGSEDHTLKVWDAASGQEKLTLKGHTSFVTSVAYSADGKRIVSGSADNTLKVWDAQSGQEKLTLKGHTSFVTSVAYSADGKRIVSGSEDKTLKVWDAQSGQEKLTLKGHTNIVLSVAYSADGKRIVSGSADMTVRVWDAPPPPAKK